MIQKRLCLGGAMLLPILFLCSCATIPQEAAVLNEEVGKSIASTHSAYVNLLNYYFAQRRERIDTAMDRYRERLIENIKAQMPPGQEDIPIDEMEKILSGLIARRNLLQEELEKTRILLMDQITKDHLQVMQANANITALLQSFVDLDKGVKNLSSRSFQAIGVDLKLEEVSHLLDKQLEEAGEATGQVTGTFEKIQALFPSKEEHP